MAIEHEFKEFKYYLQNELGLAKNTVLAYERDISTYVYYLKKYPKLKSFRELEEIHLKNYINTLKKDHLKASSYSRKISALRSLHKFLSLGKDSWTDEDLGLTLKSPKQEQRLPNVLNQEDVFMILDSIKTDTELGMRNKAMLELLYATGLRVSELLDLRTSDLHINQSYLIARGKGDKERILPINDACLNLLRDYIIKVRPKLSKAPLPYLFLNSSGKRLSRQGFFKLLKKIALEAGVYKDVTPHTIRHSFASHLLNNGVDLRFVQELLGHEDISTTQIYTHLDKKRLKEIYETSHPHVVKAKTKKNQ
ncbi:MAG: site-specific tyrosine recombinase XerD [Erysipelotrichales bacterium]|nr:site-specific tyrosine recombinase XerD [Erysipelotrichales bacterium]